MKKKKLKEIIFTKTELDYIDGLLEYKECCLIFWGRKKERKVIKSIRNKLT